jgi:hypothetical protein
MRPPFIRVVPDEVEHYGAAGAVVIAHIRYRCATDGPGRIAVDHVRWWRASHTEIGREVGMSADSVRRVLDRRLANVVEAAHHHPTDDQRRSYRVASDLPVGQIADVSTCQSAKSPGTAAKSPTPSAKSPTDRGQIADCTPYRELGELEEGGENARAADDEPSASESVQPANDPLPSPFCPKHPNGTDQRCPDCGAARRRREAIEERTAQAAAEARARFLDEVADCSGCDELGWVESDNSVTRCPKHDWARAAPSAKLGKTA